MAKRVGRQTLRFDNKPRIVVTTSIVGPKEGEGPLKNYFDIILQDDLNGKDSFEKAESSIMYNAIQETLKKANLKEQDINYLVAGDLLNQTAASNFAARDIDMPFLGLYGACSTMSESLGVASMLVDGNYADYAIAATSSHFSSAERQFRYPLEMGAQRTPTAQWTVTGSGAMLISNKGTHPYTTFFTVGKIKDYGQTDTNDMGSAMAPAAVDTLKQHFIDTGRKPQDYDLIASGDLGKLGKKITMELLKEYGYDISSNYIDCGDEIFDKERQKVQCGGSGCGCSAVVSCGYIYKNILNGKFKKVLIVSTGALMSPTTSLQGESIPGIAHAVSIEFGGK
ncbi:stage V sporulation protein AD [Clostridium homopropionicum DSM 5847]|uniref:Stage V sporulation protein AD n=1 Tax=Clostridium homopropionicum DSM 5847 TaxID=1121318 RepID=A0A0L6ZDT1_9CLOT|nr:stage V sporulation protein AD [Clostridium homopropionicum]KOA21102.1 stage V sporulation protein AD [Clostridium homopropionicum DSM 5847]SFF97257.1 stage V sporulation protein AD [Clostridium homopropionicum]